MPRVLIMVALAAFLCGCAGYRDTTRLKMEALPQHYSQFDVRIAWDAKAAGEKSYIEGVVKNVRYVMMYDLEIRVEALDPSGKVRGRGTSFVIPSQLRMDESAEFSVKLPVPLQPGERVRFTYSYRGSDADGDEGLGGEPGTFWTQSFEAYVPRK